MLEKDDNTNVLFHSLSLLSMDKCLLRGNDRAATHRLGTAPVAAEGTAAAEARLF